MAEIDGNRPEREINARLVSTADPGLHRKKIPRQTIGLGVM